jgi:hypothetical protein
VATIFITHGIMTKRDDDAEMQVVVAWRMKKWTFYTSSE